MDPNGPAYTATQTMRQDDLNNDKTLADIMKMRQAYQQQDQMNPMLLDQQRLANQTTQAQLPGVVGNSQSLAARGQVDQAGVPDNIATNASNSRLKLDSNRVEMMQNYGQKMSLLGATMQNQPAVVRAAMMHEQLPKMGIDPDSEDGKYVMSMTPEQLALTGKQMSLVAAKHQQEMDKEQSQRASAERVAAGNNATSIRVAEIGANAKITAAQAKQAAYAEKDPVAKMTKLSQVPQDQRDDQWQQQWGEALNMVAYAGQSKTPQLAPSVMNGQPVPTLDAQRQGLAGSAPQSPEATVQSAATKAWGAYEPSKYDYRIGPNGNLQRKAK